MYDQTGLVDCQIGLIKLVISKTDPVDCKIGLIDYKFSRIARLTLWISRLVEFIVRRI